MVPIIELNVFGFQRLPRLYNDKMLLEYKLQYVYDCIAEALSNLNKCYRLFYLFTKDFIKLCLKILNKYHLPLCNIF